MPSKRKRDDDDGASSSSDASETQLKSAKDRECPFCHQAFTSSSLGRHLDLYIRPVNPKRPDGVHNIDEIRKIRGGITRRQPKGTKEKPDDIPLPPSSHHINGADWRTTGVINTANGGRQQSTPVHSTPNGATPPPRLPPLSTTLESDRAAELALREVMDSLAAARRQHDKEILFDGKDLRSLSFPGLCLVLLPAPRTLYSTTPFPDRDSWDLQPPSDRERHLLEMVAERRIPGLRSHIVSSFSQWMQLTNHEQSRNWELELMRAYSNAKSITDGLKMQLALSQQRVAHLEREYELLSSCQLPREKLLNPPNTVPITPSTLENLDLEGTADSLIEKWRTTIRTVARPKRLNTMNYAESATANNAPSKGQEPGTMDLSADMIMSGAVFGVDGPMSRSGQFGTPKSGELVRYANRGHVSEIVEKG